MNIKTIIAPSLALALVLLHANALTAADEAKSVPVKLAEGKLEMTSPAAWIPKEPKFRGIVDFEFAIPKVEGDNADARVTVGGLSGGLEANKQRWFMQFSLPEGGKPEDAAKTESKKLADCKIEIIDLSGTYAAPPFAGGGKYKNYRLLVAVIDGGKLGSYYVKCYGPAKTMEANEKAFATMIDSLKLK